MDDKDNNNRYIWHGPFIRMNENYKFKSTKDQNTFEIIIDIIGIFLPWVWNFVPLIIVMYGARLFYLINN